MNVEFLTVEDVLEIHQLQLARFGGGDGLRDLGLLATLVFLDLNGVSLLGDTDRFYDLTIAVASGSLDKRQVAETLRGIAGAQQT